jgi:hypothetical protein
MDGFLADQRATLLDVYVVHRACRGVDVAFLHAKEKQGLHCPLDGLSPEQQKLLESYRERFMTLVVGSMLLGSWFGIAHIVPFVPAGVAAAMRHAGVATREGIKHRLEDAKAHFERDIWISAREATDLAASRSRIGQEAAVFAMRREVQLSRQDASHLITSSRR